MGLTQSNIDELAGFLHRGDRGGYYLRYAEMVRSEDSSAARQATIQAQIATYSGGVGGLAISANPQAKMARPSIYTVSLDDFSIAIVDKHFADVRASFEGGGSGILTETAQLLSAKSVWIGLELGNLFPGNVLLSLGNLASDGAANSAWSLRAVVNGQIYGNRADEFQGPNYQRTETSDLLVIKDTSDPNNQKVVFVADKTMTMVYPTGTGTISINEPGDYEGFSATNRSIADYNRNVAKFYLGADQERTNPQTIPELGQISPNEIPDRLRSLGAVNK
jgi:hypothetical protein